MRTFPLAFIFALPCSGCFLPSAAVQAGYSQMALSGNAALSQPSGSLAGTSTQDVESALGLGGDQGNPYVRAELDIGSPVLTVSAMQFDEQGRGTLSTQYGNLAGGTTVDSDLTFTNLKASLAFEIGLGPVSVAPGIAVDVFDLDLLVGDTVGIATERIDIVAPVPLAFVRAEADLAIVGAVAELGYITVPDIGDVEGTFWDAELLVEVRPTPLLHLFAGYRHIHMDGEGSTDDREFAVDLDLSGWMIGGGVRF